jgi:lipid-binding SYLF domain-containing protein
MRRYFLLAAILGWGMSATHTSFANGPADTVVEAEQVLGELMAIPGKQIPHRLLEEAQGIAIIPNVIKIGFVAGARRGHGIVMVRDHDGEWSLPQFVTLTGGSVGWQAGIQGTDVVLIFTTRKSVEGLMNGKFTVGVDASVSAGPVGREAAAGTDATLQSEILSYSRSRGLFVGASLEGTALEIDHDAHVFYYGTPSGALPRRVPAAAADLRHFLADLTPKNSKLPVATETPAPVVSPRLIEGLRRSLIRSSDQLQTILSPEWKPYLALPKELQQPGTTPPSESLTLALSRYAHVNVSADYRRLAQRPEFQTTYELLREYEQAVTTAHPTLQLPPPPKDVRRN